MDSLVVYVIGTFKSTITMFWTQLKWKQFELIQKSPCALDQVEYYLGSKKTRASILFSDYYILY